MPGDLTSVLAAGCEPEQEEVPYVCRGVSNRAELGPRGARSRWWCDSEAGRIRVGRAVGLDRGMGCMNLTRLGRGPGAEKWPEVMIS